MTDEPGRAIGRQRFLTLLGSGAAAAALAACGSSGSARRTTSSASSTPASSSGTPSPTPSTTRAAPETLDALASRLKGPLLRRGDQAAAPGTLLYNPRFAGQSPPQAVARVTGAEDVAAAVHYSALGGAPLSVLSGGHSYGGWSAGTGLVIDTAPLSYVHVASDGKTATIGAGTRLATVYHGLAAKNLALGGGSCASVGIAGLTLGGGQGVLASSFGLTCDQLVGATVVTADGRIRTVDADHDPDLFWALRGGGGSFGAVTSFTFDVRPAPTVTLFTISWSFEHAADVLTAWQQWAPGLPREMWTTCKLLANTNTGLTALVAGTWTGAGSPSSVLARLTGDLPAPSNTYVGNPMSYGDAMFAEAGCSAGATADACVSQALGPSDRLPFTASSSVVPKALSAAGVQKAVSVVDAATGIGGALVEAGISFDALGTAVTEVGPSATAFPWRRALAVAQHTATYAYDAAGTDATPYQRFTSGARTALQPYVGGGCYSNYADPTLHDWADAYWGDNLARLRQIKKQYDPDGLFATGQLVR